MVVRLLMRLMSHFANNEQMVSRLAESYPIRRSAQLLAYLYHRSNGFIQSGEWRERIPQAGQRAVTFKNRFVNELKQEMEQAKDRLKK